MEQNPVRNDARKERRKRQPAQTRACLLSSPSQIEEHHVAGRNNDANLTAFLCREHHDEQHEHMRDNGASMEPPNNLLDWLISWMRGVGTFLHSLADSVFEWVERLIKFRDSLCAACRNQSA